MAATAWGNRDSGAFPLGLLTVTTPGTPIPLSTNVSLNTVWGTPTGGVHGLTTSGSPSTLNCNVVKVMAQPGNSGPVFLVYKGQGYNGTGGTSVILAVPPGDQREIVSYSGTRPFQVDQMGLDAVNASDAAYVTVVLA